MRKKFLIALTLASLLFSCASGDGGLSSSLSSGKLGHFDHPVSIDFLCMTDKNYTPRLQEFIASFREAEPNVTVNLANPLGAGSYANIERIVIAGFYKEDYPDIVQGYPDNIAKYIDRDYAIDVDPYLANEEYGLSEADRQDYIASFMAEGSGYRVPGTYSLPFCKSTELMYYNADALLGLDLSAVDASINGGDPLDADYLDSLTWEELFEKLCPAIKTHNDALPAAEKILLTDSEDNPKSAIFTYDSDENFFITLAHHYGYGYTSVNAQGAGSIDFDNPGMRALAKTLFDAKEAGYLHTRNSYENYVSELFTKRAALFTVSSTAGLSYNYPSTNPFSVGVARLPHAAGREYSSINQGPSVCLLDHHDEDRALASFLFWKHITNEENSTTWALRTGYMGIRSSAYQSDAYRKAIATDAASNTYAAAEAKNFLKIADVSASTFNTPVFRGSSNARTDVGVLLRKIFNSDGQEATIADLFSQYAEDAESYLA